MSNRITAFPSPGAHQSQYKAATGYEWSTDGLWDAENKRPGVPISFFINKIAEKKKDTISKKPVRVTDSIQRPSLEIPSQTVTVPREQATGTSLRKLTEDSARTVADSVLANIYNDRKELIRTIRWGVDTGFNRQYWGMEERGYRQPGTLKPRPGAPEPAGFAVLPGTYKVVINLGTDADSVIVDVKDDPRMGNRNDIKLAQRKMHDRLRGSADKLTDVIDRLTEAEEVATKMLSQLKGMEGKETDSLRKATTALQDSIKSIREFISGKNSDRQGISRPPQITVMTKLQQARQYISSKPLAPGTQEERLVSIAESAIRDALQRINAFFEANWKNYRRQVEGTKINLFKDYKPIE